jgi:malic enzyme
VFLAAARQLASLVPQDRLDVGAIYPDQAELRSVSFNIATAVVSELQRLGVGRAIPKHSIADEVGGAMWSPEFTT